MADYINTRWEHLLHWDDTGVLSPENLQKYANALQDFGAPTRSIFGFLDCTIQQTCCPGDSEELVYTGYKKFHGMKFQGVVVPNGLLAHLEGPFRTLQNDSGVLKESNLLSNIEEYAIQLGSEPSDPPQDRWFQLYGDSAYSVSPFIVSPYHGRDTLTPEQCEWNKAMGRVRISVEHGFGLVLQDWPFLHVFWKMKIFGNACGTLYRVAVLLTNAHTCLVPNQTSTRYNCMPPTLEEYFHS